MDDLTERIELIRQKTPFNVALVGNKVYFKYTNLQTEASTEFKMSVETLKQDIDTLCDMLNRMV